MAVSSSLTALLDAFDDPRLFIRSDYTVAYANKAFRRRYGARDCEGRRCHEVLFHESRSCSECGWECPLDRAAVENREAKCLRRELVPGGERFIELRVTPIPASDGRPLYFMEQADSKRSGFDFSSWGVVAKSPAAKRVLADLSRVTELDLPVLFSGEPGSGKESFARALHENSRRGAQPFVAIGCDGLTEEALDDEFFGRQNRMGERVGGLVNAGGGTLYFDEIGVLSPETLHRLLVLLETGMVRRKGTAEARVVDYRILCATSMDLKRRAAEGLFRADLYCRLSTYRIEIPPLAERREDIPEIASIILRSGSPSATLSADAVDYLCSRAWPGNVRELSCLLTRAKLLACEGAAETLEINSADLFDADLFEEGRPIKTGGETSGQSRSMRRHRHLNDEEKSNLLEAAREWRGSRKTLAKRFGVSERTLYRLLQKAAAAERDV